MIPKPRFSIGDHVMVISESRSHDISELTRGIIIYQSYVESHTLSAWVIDIITNQGEMTYIESDLELDLERDRESKLNTLLK